MDHARVEVPKSVSLRRKLYQEALLNSYAHTIDELNTNKSWRRQEITKSFNEILESSLNDEDAHWTILYRKSLNDKIGVNHWEFGTVVKNKESRQHLWILVRPDLTQKIFKKYKLKIIKY